MSTAVLIAACVIGALLVGFFLFVAQVVAPYVLGGLVVAFGIYQGVQIEGDWGWILGISSSLGGTAFILFHAWRSSRESQSSKAPKVQKKDPPEEKK